jgi:hypothetical protein
MAAASESLDKTDNLFTTFRRKQDRLRLLPSSGSINLYSSSGRSPFTLLFTFELGQVYCAVL